MRTRRRQRQRARLPQPPCAPEDVLLPGYEADQEEASQEREANAAWYEDPSRMADKEWKVEWQKYKEWLGLEDPPHNPWGRQ